MSNSIELEDEIFLGKDKIERKTIEEFRIKGLEEIATDLKEHDNWDGVTKVGCLAVRVDRHGSISQDILHLLGATEAKRLDAKVVFGNEYQHEDHQVKIEKVDLSHFRFRGSLRSAFLGSGEFNWTVMRPSKNEPGAWREVDKASVIKDGGKKSLHGSSSQTMDRSKTEGERRHRGEPGHHQRRRGLPQQVPRGRHL